MCGWLCVVLGEEPRPLVVERPLGEAVRAVYQRPTGGGIQLDFCPALLRRLVLA